jgi:hypothetical protein
MSFARVRGFARAGIGAAPVEGAQANSGETLLELR